MEKQEATIIDLKGQLETKKPVPASSPVTTRRKILKQMAAGVAGLGAFSLGMAVQGAVQAQQEEDSAIEASGGATGYGGKFSGGIAQLRLVPSENIGTPALTGHKVGELYVDQKGNLFYAAGSSADTATSWRKIAGADSVGTFHILPQAVRVAATFASPAPTVVNPKLISTGAKPGNAPATSSVALQISGIGGIPAGATGVMGVLTSVGATSGGNLRFWTGNNVPETVNLNITGALATPPNLSISFVIALDSSGKVNFGYGTGAIGAECGYAVDVTGYFI